MKNEKKNLKEYYSTYSNDKRIKDGKKGICCLCQKERQLRLSHIVPKWVYFWSKKEGNGAMVGRYKSLNIQVPIQDGSKNYLLCDTCEQYLGVAENYIKILMHGSNEEKNNVNIVTEGEFYKNLNVELIQRFIFGVVLRSHFATSAPFHKISLGGEKMSNIRNRIFNPIKEDFDFPIVAMKFYSKKIPTIDPKAMMFPGQSFLEGSVEYLSFLIAGWEWILFLNQDRLLIDPNFIYMSLSKEGTLYVPSGDITDHRFFKLITEKASI